MNEFPAFDESVLDLLKSELGAEDTAQVLKTFLADTGRRTGLCDAIVSDRMLVKREVHSIKSSAATFGFAELSEIAQTIERDAAGMSDQQLREAVAALRDSFGRTSVLAQSILSGLEAEGLR